jgi:hypothetical protein
MKLSEQLKLNKQLHIKITEERLTRIDIIIKAEIINKITKRKLTEPLRFSVDNYEFVPWKASRLKKWADSEGIHIRKKLFNTYRNWIELVVTTKKWYHL